MTDNERLCRWLGIEPKYWWVTGKNKDGNEVRFSLGADGEHVARSFAASLTDGTVDAEYPDLSTREGFWLLWDALSKAQWQPRLWADESGGNYACVDGDAPASAQACETPWAALFAAAMALMDREESYAGPV